tara:strand:+ start:1391 stop:2089 length:699 start_codon:yes stop_codon:yes gene_type:complete
MKRNTLDNILKAEAAKIPIAIVTRIIDGAQVIIKEYSPSEELEIAEHQLDEIISCIKDNKSRLISNDELFVHVLNPPLRLIIIGAVHISQALAPMATVAGYDVFVVDPRGSFATESRFPDTKVVDDWPDDALMKLSPDTRTAVVTLTHDPKLDDPALEVALKGPAFYIASLGSRRTHAQRLTRLREKGFTDDMLQRIHGPAGLDIGAISPSEIAISILAQLTSVLHDKGESL